MNKKIDCILILMIFGVSACTQISQPSTAQNLPAENVIVAEPVTAPTTTAIPSFELPNGFKPYTDTAAGITIFIPESWIVSQTVAGQYAILQSYPADKYIGGEAFQPGDTKCDLSIKTDSDADTIIQQWKSGDLTVVEAEEAFQLRDGLEGKKLILQSMGASSSVFVELNRNTVILSCYGDFALFDTIAFTLGAASN